MLDSDDDDDFLKSVAPPKCADARADLMPLCISARASLGVYASYMPSGRCCAWLYGMTLQGDSLEMRMVT